MRVDLAKQIVLRWDSDSDCSGLLASGAIDAVLLERADGRVAAACRAGGAETLDAGMVRFVGRDEAGPQAAGDFVAIKDGVWPGARAGARGADGAFTAGASQHAWVDANGYLVAWSKALFPGRAPVLGYLPDREAGIAQDQAIAYDSLELALVDAWAAGGNYLLAPIIGYSAIAAFNETPNTLANQAGQYSTAFTDKVTSFDTYTTDRHWRYRLCHLYSLGIYRQFAKLRR